MLFYLIQGFFSASTRKPLNSRKTNERIPGHQCFEFIFGDHTIRSLHMLHVEAMVAKLKELRNAITARLQNPKRGVPELQKAD